MIVWPVHRGSTSTQHPRGWKWERLTDLAELVTGHTPARNKPEYWDGGVSWINLNEIRELDGLVCEETRLQISELGVANSSAVVHPVGTVCMSRTASVGFVTQMGERMATSQDFVNWICGSAVDPSFLVKALIASRPHLTATATGSTHKTLYVRDAERLHVLLPPIEEQRRIAAVLDAAEALRVKRRQALSKLDTLTPAIFYELFGDPVRNERGWPVHPLREVCLKIQIGPFGSLLHKSDYIEGGTPLVNPMHIVEGVIRPRTDQTINPEKNTELRHYRMEVGDVVMGRRGEMGRVAIVGEDEAGFVCGSGSLYMRPDPDHITSRYLAAALSNARGRRHLENSAQGVTMLNLNSDIVGSFALGLPPIELQREFSAILTTQGGLKAGLRDHTTALDELFASLQQRAFRGEL